MVSIYPPLFKSSLMLQLVSVSYLALFSCFITINKPDQRAQSVVDVKIDDLIPAYEKRYNEEAKTWILYPVFSDLQKSLDGSSIRVKGFVRKYPDRLGPLVFLGQAKETSEYTFHHRGPDLIIGIHDSTLSDEQLKEYQNKKVTVLGRLTLNDSDIDNFIYQLSEVKIVK